LIIIEQEAFFAELLSEHAILGTKILDDVLLSFSNPVLLVRSRYNSRTSGQLRLA